MKKIIIFLMYTLLLTSCQHNETESAYSNQNITPNIMSLSENDNQYYYVIDKNTHVVYLAFNGVYRAGITVLVKADGTPMLAEDLGIEVGDANGN